jgi:putative transposase
MPGRFIFERVSMLLNIEPKEIMIAGKYPQVVAARSLVCYWANRELGMTTIELAIRFNLSQPTIRQDMGVKTWGSGLHS